MMEIIGGLLVIVATGAFFVVFFGVILREIRLFYRKPWQPRDPWNDS